MAKKPADETLTGTDPLPARKRTEPSVPPLAGGTYVDGVQVERLHEPEPVKE